MGKTKKALASALGSGDWDKTLSALYGSRDMGKAYKRYEKLLADFREAFGREAAGVYSAPGRTELGGNHTDHQGGRVLSQVDEGQFMKQIPRLRAEAGDRAVLRSMHFFWETRRAREQAEALKQGDMSRFLALVKESGRSSASYLQNVVPSGRVSHQELALTLALCEKALGGRGAFRLHGGGFGGTAQAFVPLDIVEGFRTQMEAVLGKGRCFVLSIRPVGFTKIGG